MVKYKNPQEWLNEKYPNKEQVEKIDLRYLRSEQSGELTIDSYSNLKEIGGKYIPNLTKITISNCPQLERIDIENLKNLQHLTINNLPSLKKLVCPENNLTNLDLTTCPNLQEIKCSNNKLTEIKLPQAEKLEYLYLSNNNFNQDLSFLKDCVNLRELWLTNNNFYGSLEFLKDLNKLKTLNIRDTDIDSGLEYLPESVKEFFCSTRDRKDAKVKTIYNLFANEKGEVETENGRIINFPQKLKEYKQKLQDYKQWKNLNFSEEKIKEWKEIGLKNNEHGLANYLKQNNFTPQTAKNNLATLRAEYKSQVQINQFIQEKNLTKIPYEHLDNIKYLTQGGFGKIYQAEWKDKNVILKSLNNSQELTPEFLREIASHNLFDGGRIVKCHGISQNPETKEYVMVMDYARGGNLRQYLQKNNNLNLKKKLIQLHSIAEGLKDIHEKGLVHKDFHSGNILSKGESSFFEDLKCHITDLGLCKPANETSQEKVYGVLPYVAPEVLNCKPYTQASDIYSFGIIAYELLANAYPYPDFKDLYPNLSGEKELEFAFISEVCSEKRRPNIDKLKIPQLLEDLIKRCWDTNPQNRPTAVELEKTVRDWIEEIGNKKDTSFYQQYLEKSNEYSQFSQNTPYKIHPTAILGSKLIQTKKLEAKEFHIGNTTEFTLDRLDLDEIQEEPTTSVNLEAKPNEVRKELEEISASIPKIEPPVSNLVDKWTQTDLTMENLNSQQKELEQFRKNQQQAQIIHNPPKNNFNK